VDRLLYAQLRTLKTKMSMIGSSLQTQKNHRNPDIRLQPAPLLTVGGTDQIRRPGKQERDMSIMYMHLRPVVPALRSRSSRRLRRNNANRLFVRIFWGYFAGASPCPTATF
jgi:hypothetical protein